MPVLEPEAPPRAVASGAGLDQPEPRSLPGLFRAHRASILAIYALFTLENLVGLAHPLVLGRALDGLLLGTWHGLALFIGQYAVFVGLGSARRAWDTRVYTRIYGELASRVVVAQRSAGVDVSQVAARSALSRQLVDFFERDLPFLLHVAYSVVGALVMLLLTERVLVLVCLGLVVPSVALSWLNAKRSLRLNAGLHDELEREVGVIASGDATAVREHYQRLGRCRVRLSDWEALQFGLAQALVLGLMTTALLFGCSRGAPAGQIASLFGYVVMFATALINVPVLIEQSTRLHDIGRRVRAGA